MSDSGYVQLGTLDLRADYGAYQLEVLAEDTSLGSPKSVLTELESFVADGSLAALTGVENRELEIMVQITASTKAGLAQGEAALVGQCSPLHGRPWRTTFSWTPPDSGVANVFDVTAAWPEHRFDDLGELRFERYYLLTLTCLPFARAQGLTTVSLAAPSSSPPTSTTINACTSLTGWSGSATPAGDTSAQLVTNSDFTSNITGWTFSGGTGAYDPAGHAVGTVGPAGYGSWESSEFAVTAGTQYAYAVHAAATAGNPYYATFAWYDASHVSLSTSGTGWATGTSGTWQDLVNSATAPAGAAYARLRVVMPSALSGHVLRLDYARAHLAVGNSASATPTLVSPAPGVRQQWTRDGLLTGAVSATINLALTGLSVNTSTEKYIRVRSALPAVGGTPSGLVCRANGAGEAPLTVAATSGDVTWFQVPPAITSVTSLHFTTTASISEGGSLGLIVSALTRTNMPTDLSSGGKVAARTIPATGSVRAPAFFHLRSATPGTGLGTVLLYTRPTLNTAPPNLREGTYSGTGTESADGSAISTKTSVLSSGNVHKFSKPAAGYVPGGHVLFVRVKSTSGAQTLNLSVVSKASVGSTPLTTIVGTSPTVTAKIAATTSWQLVAVAALALPETPLPAGGWVTIELTGDNANVILDDGLIFNTDEGALTWVECPTTGYGEHLWVDPPTINNPTPAYWVGGAADRSDAYGIAPKSFGTHFATPPTTNAYQVTTNVPASLDEAHYPTALAHVG